MKLGIIDLNVGNIGSLISAMHKLNLKFKIYKNESDFDDVNKLILPGVGAFGELMKNIKEKNIDRILKEKIKNNCSLLGVCAGFQVLFESSNEHKFNKGLCFLKGKFKKFDEVESLQIPHVGWNQCKIIKDNPLYQGIKNNSDFYFTHSYILHDSKEEYYITETNYINNFISSVNLKNIYGVQFHPEKSQNNGLKILKNFANIC